MMKRTTAAGLGAMLALALVGAGVSAASAADTITPDEYFAGTFWLADSNAEAVPATLEWNADVVALKSTGDFLTPFIAPATGTELYSFIAPRGSESNPNAWNAKIRIGEVTALGDTMIDVTPENQSTLGSGTPTGQAGVRAAGGDYSLGFAYTANGGLAVTEGGLYFIHIHVTAGTGEWTYSTVCDGTVGDCGDPGTEPVEGSPATQGLSAEVTTPPVVDGLLSMVAPTSTTSTIGNATIVNGKSQSTGTLGTFQVQDGRALTKPGWTLTTTSVGDFVNGATTIPKVNLGLAPRNVAGVPAALGVAQVAGSATYPSKFAELAAGTAGTTSLDADLTFVAPAGSPAGTYTSTLTVTLVSK